VRWLGWAAAWVLLLMAAGGAADARGAVLLAAPPWPAVVVATLAIGGLVVVRGAAGGRVLLGLAPLVPVLLLGAPLAGLRALTGPPLLAIVAAGAVLAVSSHRRPPAWLFLPTVLALYAAVSWRVQVQVGPEGDEPHYLMVADSLLRDRDVSLARDYELGRYRAFHPRPLQPHYRVRGRHGEIYSLHAVGLSLLILPAYLLGGYPAVSFFMAAVAALVAREVRALARDWTGDAAVAQGVGWLVALSPPLIHYAGLVFTEVPAALILAWTVRRAAGLGEARPAALLGWGAALALLPWLNVRYGLLAGLVLLYALYAVGRGDGPRECALGRAAMLLAPLAVSALGLALYHWTLYGFFDPRLVYGRRPEFAVATLVEGLPGLLLDQEFGLLVYAPFLVLAVPGLIARVRARPSEAVLVTTLTGAALLVAGSWHMWRGGFNPPARFLVPVVPLLAAAVAFNLRRGVGAAAALVIGWSLWTGLAAAWEPRLVHRDRDGTAPLFRARSGAEEWTRLLPAYVLAEPGRHGLSLVWGAALAAVAVLAARGTPRHPAALAAGWAGLAVAAATASGLSQARTGGRDAVRVVGRPAMYVPRWTSVGAAPARWGPEVLAWGPLFEPHRHPAGAELGVRLPLPPGRYRLSLAADVFEAGSEWGRLEARPEPAGAPRREPLRRTPDGLEADFEVRPGERALTLVLVGGPPLLVKELRLEIQPFASSPV
jgi:hypothetical protein